MSVDILKEDIKTIAEAIQVEARQLEGKTILITGGAGFLGNYFISTFNYLNENVFENPCKIISVDNFSSGVKYSVEESATFKPIKHDVSQPLDIDEDVDFIISAAGLASPRYYRKYKIETIDVGVFGTKNMLELAWKKKVKSMLYFSSSEVYGDPDPRFVPTPETYPGHVPCIGPRANYDESKRLGETLCYNYFEVYGTPVKMVRPFNVYGPCMRLDDYRVLPNFLSHIFQGKPMPVYGDGRSTRTFCYVTDGITGFLKAFLSEHQGEVFNIGTASPEITIMDLAKEVASLFDNKVEMDLVQSNIDAYTDGDPRRRCPDLSKATKLLNYAPNISLRDGIKRFITWAIFANNIDSPAADLFCKIHGISRT